MIPPVADRFVAGETPAVALDHARAVNADGLGAILNLLGEHHGHRAAADADTAAYLGLLADLDGSGLEACISIKPTQVGLAVDETAFRENYRRIVAAAADRGGFVWCDMEDASTTDATLNAFADLAEEFPGRCGVCVQANLRRTREDLDRIAGLPGKVRLVKGAYREPETVAYTAREAVNDAYREDLELLFRDHGGGIGVASHDPAMIAHAIGLAETYDADFEFQMLMGVSEAAQRELAADGYDVWQYVPYGSAWLAYFYRRLRERRENLAFAVRAILGG